MSKKRPLLLIAICAWMALLQACRPIPQVIFPFTPARSTTPLVTLDEAAAQQSIASIKPLQAPAESTPQPTLAREETSVQATSTPTVVFTPTVTLTETVTPPPTLTPIPTDPLGDEEGPEGKVLHAILKRREDITPEPLTATEYQPFETELLQRMNEERAKVGAGPLVMSPLLSIVAQSHSDEMASHNFFGHNSMNGLSFVERIKKAGYVFSAAAENLFAGSGPYNSPEYVVKVWLNSSTHRNNMLDPKYNEVGIGYRFNPDSTYGGYFTADFGTP